MKDFLFRLRNISNEKARRAHVIERPALRMLIREPRPIILANYFLVEDMTVPGHANLGTTEQFRGKILPILNGLDSRWHLWEVTVYRKKLVLAFADLEVERKNAPITALKCYLPWPEEEVELEFFTQAEDYGYVKLKYLPYTSTNHMLQLRYEKDNLVLVDSYEVFQK